MICHSVSKLAEVGIRDVLIITGTEHMGAVVGTLGSGRAVGMEFTYRVQDEAGGIAQALGLAEGFLAGDRCVALLADNVFYDSLAPYLRRYVTDAGAMLLLKEVPDPGRYGVAIVEDGQIVRIEEKPQHPRSQLAVTGIYMFDHRSMDYIAELQPSKRGELEIADVHNRYIAAGSLRYDILPGWWTDAGTHASLALANQLAKDVTLRLFDGLF